MNSLLIMLFLFLQDPDSKKSAQQLFTEGQRFETVDRNYEKAIEKYTKAIEKGKANAEKTLTAHALHNLARCHETMEPENIGSAQEAWKQIASDYSDIQPYGEVAANKVRWKGVDVYLKQFKAACDRWRDNRRDQAALTTSRETAWGKITGLSPDTDAIDALVDVGLAYDDEVVRAFAADCLARVINDIDKIVTALGSANPVVRGGAALALERVFQIWQEGEALDAEAKRIVEEFNIQKLGASDVEDIDQELKNANQALEDAKTAKSNAEKRTGGDADLQKSEIRLAELRVKQAEDHVKMLENVQKTHERATTLRKRAEEARHNIPKEIGTPKAQAALATLIADDTADPTARLEATKALLQIGDISGELAAALIQGLEGRNKNVRVGCARAAAAVSTEKSEDKLKLADKLIELVQFEPEKQAAAEDPTPDEVAQIRDALAKIAAASEEEAPAAIQALVELGDKAVDPARKASGQASGKMRARYDAAISTILERRNANEPFVRQACAQALGKIGLVKSIPALIEALEDNDAAVRREANEALILLTGQNFGYESDPNIPDPERKKSEAEKRAEQLKIRMAGVEKWQAWWKQTSGVPVLIDRFWRFQASWTTFNAADLFDRDFFFRKAVQPADSSVSPEKAAKLKEAGEARAQRVYDAFQKEKNIFVMDARDLARDIGPEVVDKLMERLDGKTDLERVFEKLGKQQRESLEAKSRAATRLFLAEAIAEIAKKSGVSAVASKLVALLGTDRAAGAAAALGLLGAEAGSEARGGLESSGGIGSGDTAVQEASANALRTVGDKSSSAKGLADVASAAKAATSPDDPKARAAVAALRSIGVLKCDSDDTIKALCDLISDDLDLSARCDLVRQWVCEALGEIGSPSALEALARARRDSKRNVQTAASEAIKKISASRKSEAAKVLFEMLKNEKLKTLDRIGAALAMGDVGHEPSVHSLVWRALDKNPPRELRDSDPAVRAAVCRALGALKSKTQFTVEKLLEAMTDPAEEVRQEAYDALVATVGADAASKITVSVPEGSRNPEEHEFKGWYEEKYRKEFLKKWKQWVDGEKGSWPKEPNREM